MYGPCLSPIGGGHPLRSPRRRSHGKPLPYRLADAPQASQKADCSFTLAGTIGNYPAFRRAMPDFSVRTCVLLPRLPVAQVLLPEPP